MARITGLLDFVHGLVFYKTLKNAAFWKMDLFLSWGVSHPSPEDRNVQFPKRMLDKVKKNSVILNIIHCQDHLESTV